MSLQIRKGIMRDADEIGELYDTLNDYLETHVNYPGWKKGVYPVWGDAVRGIADDCLYVATAENKIVGTFMLRHEPEAAYQEVCWKKDIPYDKVFVIYTFVVHPACMHQKIGTQLLEYAEKAARESGVESLRLDVYEGNLPAIHLYEKNQFDYIGTVDLGLEAYGLKWFKLYEKSVI